MEDRVVKQITMPDGSVVRGILTDFEIVKEDWNEYILEDGTKLRIKTVLVRALRLVDDEGQPRRTPDGDPEIFVNTSITVVANG